MQLEARVEKLAKPLARVLPKVVYAVEPLLFCLEEVALAAYASYQEVGIDPENVPYNPDWEHAFTFEPTGDIIVVTARKRDRLVGYGIAFIGPFKQSKHVQYAEFDTIWLDPNQRNGSVGINLIKRLEQAILDTKKVEFILAGHSFKKDIGPVLKRLGYKPAEVIYYKNVGSKYAE